MKFFGRVRRKNFDRKSWYALPIHNFFSIPKTFWKTEGFLRQIFRFGPVRQKISTKPWCPPLLSIKSVSLPEIFWNTAQKGSSTKFFSIVRQKSWQKTVTLPPPPLIHKVFRYQKFSETQIRRVPIRIFLALWDSKTSTQNRDTTP